jgi:hypothetical protein
VGRFFLSPESEAKEKTPHRQTEAKTMEYRSNNNRNGNSASTASNGLTGSIASNRASGSENRTPATAQQLVRESVQYLIDQLEAGQSEALTAYLNAMVHFPNYSFGNVLLIARQKPDARNVAGMWAWNQLGRRVKRGEKGIAILAPMIAKTRKDESKSDGEAEKRPTLLGFRKVYVWDESSTEGAPLPDLEKVTGDAGNRAEEDSLTHLPSIQRRSFLGAAFVCPQAASRPCLCSACAEGKVLPTLRLVP